MIKHGEKQQLESLQLKSSLKKIIKIYLRDPWWTVYGKRYEKKSLPTNIQSILFLCKGNICRSPFAEYLAREKLKLQDRNLSISSAGLEVGQSLPPPLEAIQTAKLFKVDLSLHMSRSINTVAIQDWDLILIMDAIQYSKFIKAMPQYINKSFLLSLYDDYSENSQKGYYRYHINDPYGKSEDSFYNTFNRIDRCITNIFNLSH